MDRNTGVTSRQTAGPAVHGLGLVVLDEQMFVERSPEIDSKVFATGRRIQFGGPVPTALAQLQRFGVGTTFLGAWADDDAGRSIEARITAAGIRFDPQACRTACASGVAHVWVETTTGRRTVVSRPPDGQPTVEQACQFGRPARLLHLDGWGGDAAIAAARACRDTGGAVTLDSGSVKPATERLLPLAHVVNAPRRVLSDYCGTSDAATGAKFLLKTGPKLVSVTDGDRGAGIFTKDIALWLPAYEIRPVDTCGAGDVFCGGLLFAHLAGYEPEPMLRFAMATAALKIGRAGNVTLPTYDEVVAFLESADP